MRYVDVTQSRLRSSLSEVAMGKTPKGAQPMERNLHAMHYEVVQSRYKLG